VCLTTAWATNIINCTREAFIKSTSKSQTETARSSPKTAVNYICFSHVFLGRVFRRLNRHIWVVSGVRNGDVFEVPLHGLQTVASEACVAWRFAILILIATSTSYFWRLEGLGRRLHARVSRVPLVFASSEPSPRIQNAPNAPQNAPKNPQKRPLSLNIGSEIRSFITVLCVRGKAFQFGI